MIKKLRNYYQINKIFILIIIIFLYTNTFGQISAQEALDQAAENWKKITKSLGADKQKEMYAKAMGY